MSKVQAWQHIYSNVEKEQSPQGKGGFQTLFYTRSGLTPDEISELEGRLLYFPAKNAEPVKRLFFMTTTGKAVVAQIVMLPEPDQYGRKGRYLAHALLFRPEDLAKFEADPFRVFRHFSFCTTVAEAIKQGDFKSGNIPPVSLDLNPQLAGDVEAAQTWPRDELKKLALLALRVEQQVQRREAITLVGPPAEIDRALAAAFLAVPVLLRPHCMFDTYFYRCNLVATFYWAIGFLEPPANIKFALVDAAARSVQTGLPLVAATAYERWVVASLEGQMFREIAGQRDQAFAVAAWLERGQPEPAHLEAASPALIGKVFAVNPQVVQELLRQHIGAILPQELVERAVTYLFRENQAIELYRHLRQGISRAALLEALYQSYRAEKFSEPSGAEVKALAQYLAAGDPGLLRLFVAHWRDSLRYLPDALVSRSHLSTALSAANEADYRHFCQIALDLGLVDPLILLVPERGELFLNQYLKSGVEDWLRLAEVLIETKQAAHLSRLAPRLGGLPRKTITALARLTSDRPEVPADFSSALQRALAALPPEKGVSAFLKSAWRRLPGLGEEKD